MERDRRRHIPPGLLDVHASVRHGIHILLYDVASCIYEFIKYFKTRKLQMLLVVLCLVRHMPDKVHAVLLQPPLISSYGQCSMAQETMSVLISSWP
jgi:hypothetical protein